MLIHRAQTVFFASVASVAQIVPPDFVIRETELMSVLSFIANTQWHSQTTLNDDIVDPVDLSFDQIYDPALPRPRRSTQKIMKFSGLAITLLEYDKLPSKSYTAFQHPCSRAA